MDELLQKINDYKAEISGSNVSTTGELENFRIRFLGTKGIVKEIMAEIKNVPVEKKKEFGLLLNSFKIFAEEKYDTFKNVLTEVVPDNKSQVDWSLPGDALTAGTRHPLSIVRNQIVSIFKRLGFAVAEGPEIEDDWHNFTALNLPENHPARDMQDTFYLHQNPDCLLRTHTSSVQARVMEKAKAADPHCMPGQGLPQ